MHEAVAIATVLLLLALTGVEPGEAQAKYCRTGPVAALLDGC
ncbi:MAG: hypothetical protein WBB85_02995 [Albidovulum sp.]|jgi:hypothetical protein